MLQGLTWQESEDGGNWRTTGGPLSIAKPPLHCGGQFTRSVGKDVAQRAGLYVNPEWTTDGYISIEDRCVSRETAGAPPCGGEWRTTITVQAIIYTMQGPLRCLNTGLQCSCGEHVLWPPADGESLWWYATVNDIRQY